MFLAQFAVFVWTAVSVAAIAPGTISLYHPRLELSHRFWFWGISALVFAMATSMFAFTRSDDVRIICGVSLVVFLFYLVPPVALIGRTSQIKEDVNSYPQTIRTLRAGAFGCLLGALVSSGLVAGVSYPAIALSVIISLTLPYFTLSLVKPQ